MKHLIMHVNRIFIWQNLTGKKFAVGKTLALVKLEDTWRKGNRYIEFKYF